MLRDGEWSAALPCLLVMVQLLGCGKRTAESESRPTVEPPALPAVADAAAVVAPKPSPPAERVETHLLVPEDLFMDIHGAAMRLGRSDSWALQKAWLLAREQIAGSSAKPKLTRSKSQRTFYIFPADMFAEMTAEAQRQDRSVSFVVLKAWTIARAQVLALDPPE